MISGGTSIFLGANTAGGYLFEPDFRPDGGHTYILKGGPGCGQSLLLKSMAEAAALLEQEAVTICSPLDPGETDGIFLPQSGIHVLDGSTNQKIEPRAVGIHEHLVDLGQCIRPEELAAHREEILARYRAAQELEARARRFLSAAGTMLSDSFHLALGALDMGKTKRFALALAKRLFSGAQKNAAPASGGAPQGRSGPPAESRIFLSGFTGRGHVFFEETIRAHAKEIYVIDDEHGVASRIILSILRQSALEAGFSVVTCLCGLHGGEKIDHLIIPSLSLAVCTSNRYHEITEFTRRYHLRRFTDAAALRKRKQRISFNRRAVRELTAGACQLFAELCAERRALEALYSDALDGELLARMITRMLARI